MTTVKDRLSEDIKQAMRARDKPRLLVLRMLQAAIKQREIDGRTALDEQQVIAVLDKLAKQHRDSIAQFAQANRTDLVDKETYELGIVESYLPAQLTADEINAHIDTVLNELGGDISKKDIGRIMQRLTSILQGKADLGIVSRLVKTRLSSE